MQRYSHQVRVNSGTAPPVVDLGAPVASPTISVFDAGTANLSTIFSNNLVAPTILANPFTGTVDGFFFFYARGGDQRYDVQVSLGTPAIAAPYIIEGDILLTWDGEPLETTRDLFTVLQNHKPGDVVKVKLLRDGNEITLDVTLKASE